MSISYITDESPAGDFESLTVSTAALGVTASKLLINQEGGFRKRAVKAFITVESQPVRFRIDGTDPTAAVGHPLAAGDSISIEGEQNVSRLRLIRSGASDATVQVTLYYNL